MKSSQNAKSSVQIVVDIDEIDYHGKGIALSTTPITIVEDALQGERLKVRLTHQSKQVQFATPVKIEKASLKRVEPFCPHYDECGGCSMQSMSASNGIAMKTRALKRLMQTKFGLEDEVFMPSVLADIDYETSLEQRRGYRRKVRIAIDARNHNKVRLGYKQQHSNQVVDIRSCKILVPELEISVLSLLASLRASEDGELSTESAPKAILKKLGHIDAASLKTGVVVHINASKPLFSNELDYFQQLAQALKLRIQVSEKGHKKADYCAENALLAIEDIAGLSLGVAINDFFQINGPVNRKMINQALEWLAPDSKAIVHDFYCGIGNFSLALAKHCGQVIAYEGVSEMTVRGKENAEQNELNNCQFTCLNLSDEKALSSLKLKRDDLVLLDPARDGAKALCEKLSAEKVKRIVYVSCNPSTLIRDLSILATRYKIKKMSTLDMFAFTQHLETMVLLES
uniref:23S rRNA (uracil(1939)-C(5))-methyltransferase RlmD n=1 Tax=Ningiella ruwaisensis TaxID=2364274 RepID=UPI001445F5F8|nr:23S rRNA (uracil(1939)-C(5))-methyltransferase RlmD [Ningiella ruwaisensis]